MPKTHHPYPREFKARLVEMVRAGRTPEELAERFEPTAQSIRNWVAQAERDAGRRDDGLTTDERDELRRLRRENKVLREEREILKRPRRGLLGRPARFRPRIRVRAGAASSDGRPAAALSGSTRTLVPVRCSSIRAATRSAPIPTEARFSPCMRTVLACANSPRQEATRRVPAASQ